jgi:hypothetical protein
MSSRIDRFFQMFQKGADSGAEGVQQQMNHSADSKLKQLLQSNQLAQENKQLAETGRHNLASEGVAKQQADTMEQFRKDQIVLQKLKTLFGAAGLGEDGKPLSNEAQKTSNLADTARSSLNDTESMIKESPRMAVAEQFIPDFVINKIGGPLKQLKDSKASTKEAMQNLYTGASASGEQVPAFQGFSGPGITDILAGGDKISSASNGTRDAINNFQKGLKRQTKTMSPEMLKAAGLENDPMAQTALHQQQAAAAAKREKQLSALSPEDRQLYQEIQANPAHPKAAAARQHLARKYGDL